MYHFLLNFGWQWLTNTQRESILLTTCVVALQPNKCLNKTFKESFCFTSIHSVLKEQIRIDFSLPCKSDMPSTGGLLLLKGLNLSTGCCIGLESISMMMLMMGLTLSTNAYHSFSATFLSSSWFSFRQLDHKGQGARLPQFSHRHNLFPNPP